MDDYMLDTKYDINNNQAIKRELWIDCLRGIGILLVILGHTNPPFKKLIYGFHIPLFFLLSGYLWKECENPIKKYLNRYIVPYFILCTINLIIQFQLAIVLKTPFSLKKNIIGILYSIGSTKYMPNCSPLWYLTCIFIAIVFFSYILCIKYGYIRIALVILSGCISYSLSRINFPKLFWNADSAMMGVVFIFFGYITNKYAILNRLNDFKKHTIFFIITILLILGVSAIMYNPITNIDFDRNYYGNIGLMLIRAISISYILFICVKFFNCNNAVSKIICWFGKHSIFFMGFDYFSESIAYKYSVFMGLDSWILLFVIKVVTLIGGLLLWSTTIDMAIKNERIKKLLMF